MGIITVSGPVAPEELGLTLTHEHIILDLRHHGYDGILDDVDLAIDELRPLEEAGCGAVVELSNEFMGRDVKALKRVSEETGLHIIASTGYYTEPYYPPRVYEWSTERLADLMVTELTEGIDGTGIRAGIIGEIGTSRDFISPAGERVFRSAARAHLRTGAAISTHTYLEQLIFDQLEILEDEGVEPGRIIIGHLGDLRDLDRLKAVAAKGVYLQIDHVGLEDRQLDLARAKTVGHLVRQGYVSQILLSMDVCFKSRLRRFGGTGYDHILRSFVPMLDAEGVTESEIRTVMFDNPQRVLAYDC